MHDQFRRASDAELRRLYFIIGEMLSDFDAFSRSDRQRLHIGMAVSMVRYYVGVRLPREAARFAF
jgi:hypothetical protein